MTIVGATCPGLIAALASTRQQKKPGARLCKTARRRRNKWLRANKASAVVVVDAPTPPLIEPLGAASGKLEERCGEASSTTTLSCEPLCDPSDMDEKTSTDAPQLIEVADTPGGRDFAEYHALRDYRRYEREDGQLVELIEVEWNGGVRSWHRRDQFETPSRAHHVQALVAWHNAGRPTPFAAFRRALVGKQPRYTAGERGLNGFVAVKIAFVLLGLGEWVSDTLVEAYIAEGDALGKDYRTGVTWEQLHGFISYLNRSLGKSSVHPCIRKIAKNLRCEGESGRAGVDKLTSLVGVYLIGFCRVGVARLVTLKVREDGSKVVYDETGCVALDQNTWMDTAQLVRVHHVSVA